MTPLVSILIPAYNAQDWIADTLRSALAQTWSRKEIIVVDDGSKDQTLAVARKYASAELRVVSQPNQGAAAARNHALSLSQGDLIQWLDADDVLATDKVTRQVEAYLRLGDKHTLLSSPFGRFYYRWHRARFTPSHLWEDLTPLEWMVRKLEGNVFMQTMSWLVTRELCEATGPWDPRLLIDDDGEYFSRMLLRCSRVVFVPDAKSYWRMSGSSSLSRLGKSKGKSEAQVLSLKLHIERLLSLENSPRTRAACLQLLNDWVLVFYPERADLFAVMQQMAEDLGGALGQPKLSWKYQGLAKIFGWQLAKTSQLRYNRLKESAARSFDRVLSLLDKPRHQAICPQANN